MKKFTWVKPKPCCKRSPPSQRPGWGASKVPAHAGYSQTPVPRKPPGKYDLPRGLEPLQWPDSISCQHMRRKTHVGSQKDDVRRAASHQPDHTPRLKLLYVPLIIFFILRAKIYAQGFDPSWLFWIYTHEFCKRQSRRTIFLSSSRHRKRNLIMITNESYLFFGCFSGTAYRFCDCGRWIVIESISVIILRRVRGPMTWLWFLGYWSSLCPQKRNSCVDKLYLNDFAARVRSAQLKDITVWGVSPPWKRGKWAWIFKSTGVRTRMTDRKDHQIKNHFRRRNMSVYPVSLQNHHRSMAFSTPTMCQWKVQ